jgi:hypothetical protein
MLHFFAVKMVEIRGLLKCADPFQPIIDIRRDFLKYAMQIQRKKSEWATVTEQSLP